MNAYAAKDNYYEAQQSNQDRAENIQSINKSLLLHEGQFFYFTGNPSNPEEVCVDAPEAIYESFDEATAILLWKLAQAYDQGSTDKQREALGAVLAKLDCIFDSATNV